MSRRRKKKFRAPMPVQAQPDMQGPPSGQALLDATEQKLESQLMPDTRESYDKIVVAGMKAGLQNGPNSIIAGLIKSKDPLADCAKGAIGLVLILKHQAKGIMPGNAMVPAAMTLMLKALSFADRTGVIKVGPDELSKATILFKDLFMQKLGITPQMMQHASMKVHALTQDPVAMEKMKLSAGLARHPNAAQATPMPKRF